MKLPRKIKVKWLALLLAVGGQWSMASGQSFSPRWDGTFDTIGGYATLNVDGMSHAMGRPGYPMLPTASRLVFAPRGTQMAIEDWRADEIITQSLGSLLLAPMPQATVKGGDIMPPLPDKQAYATDSFYRPCRPVSLEHIGTMGEREVYRLTIAPVEYNPVRGEVRFYMGLQWTIVNDEGRMGNEKLETGSSSFLTPHSSFLIVSRPQFREGLQRFVDWKRQEGFAVQEIYADTNDCDSIKAMIAGISADYILLVGDADQIAPFAGTTRPSGMTTHKTDLYYAERTGDYLPDAMLGRWPVNDTAELRAVVDKTLRYEQGVSLDTAMLRRTLLVAGREGQQPAPVTTNGQVNYIKERLATLLPGVDTICHYNPASDTQRADILQTIAAGTALVNYTAHCVVKGWSHPAVKYTATDSLDENQPTFYINNCCLSNAFDDDCFGEHLLRKMQGGAVGVVGATNSTLWNEDYYWAVGPKYPFSLAPEYDSLQQGAFDEWFGNVLVSAAGIMQAGNMAVTAFGSPYDKFYWEIYCLLGDPSLRPYLGVPQPLWLAVADTILVGATQVRVNGTPGAKVTAVQGSELLGVSELGADGSATLSLRLPVDTLPLIVTVTAPQAMAAVDTVVPMQRQGRAMTFRHVSVSDTAVDFTLANIGTDTLYNPYVRLMPDTTSALFVATVHLIDSLLPGEELPLHTTMTVLRWAQQWSGVLEACDGDGMVQCRIQMGHLLDQTPTLNIILMNADSTAATDVRPNTEYILSAVVDGLYDSLSVVVSAWPDGEVLPMNGCRFNTPDSLTHLHLQGRVVRGDYGRDYDYWLVAGDRVDSLAGGLDSYPWNLSTMRPWMVDSTVRHSGRCSLRSSPIVYRQTSDLLIDLLLPADDSVSFWVKVVSEEGDKLTFSIDGQYCGGWSGVVDWNRRCYPVSAGRHTLRWRYAKDESGTLADDCGWIDDLRLPLALWDSAYGWFGTIDEPQPQGIEDGLELRTNIDVYPNPVDRWLTIDAPGEVTLTDVFGRTVYTSHTDGTAILDLGGLPAGIYIGTLRDNGTVCRFKIMRTNNN